MGGGRHKTSTGPSGLVTGTIAEAADNRVFFKSTKYLGFLGGGVFGWVFHVFTWVLWISGDSGLLGNCES